MFRQIVKVLLCAGLVKAVAERGRTYHLDTSLFMNRLNHKTVEGMQSLLSSMDADDLTRHDIQRLAAFAGMSEKHFMDEYVVEV